MQTLSQLQSGELAGIRHLKLSENLTTFPEQILTLADSLEILDLSNNLLTSLPEEISQLHQLKVIFASDNLFETLPAALGQCPNLEMVGFKANKIKQVPGNALPAKLRWLILTDNQIRTLPKALGERPRLQKLALAGNRLTALPQTIENLHNLELIRISANQLNAFPEQLLSLPKLAWCAFAGNPFSQTASESEHSVPEVSSTSFTLQQVLGQGASGVIYQGQWQQPQTQFANEIAVKVFKGEVTSDGYPKDELQACLHLGEHPNLVKSLAQVNEDGYLALIMDLIPGNYRNLGLPPCFKSCTRDNFSEGFSLSIATITKIVKQMEDVYQHLHANKVCHGDLYAHNTLIDPQGNIIFGDFGAATIYHMLTEQQQQSIKQIERRALNHFIDDLLSICTAKDQLSEQYQQLKQQIYS